VRFLPAYDQSHPDRSADQVDQTGDLHHAGFVVWFPSASRAACHADSGTRWIAYWTVIPLWTGRRIEYSTDRPRSWLCSVSQSSSWWVAPGTGGPDEQPTPMRRGDLSDRVGEDADVVAGVVGVRVARPQPDGETIAGVVAPHAEGVEPESALEVRRRQLLVSAP